MALDFPNSPTVGQIFPAPQQAGAGLWQWDGSEWKGYVGSTSVANLSTKTRVFTSSGSYVPTAGMIFCIAECLGGGGAGGGCASSSLYVLCAGGGGAGAYSRALLTAQQIGASQTVTIGAGGVPGAAGNVAGGNGGTTSLGSLCSAAGGTGASGIGVANASQGGAGGLASSGIGDFKASGATGIGCMYFQITTAAGALCYGTGVGASSPFGGGGLSGGINSTGSIANGGAATGFGAGGGGCNSSQIASGNGIGGAGSSGVVIVTEFGYFGQISSAIPLIRGMLQGMAISMSGGATNFFVAPGVCCDSTAVAMMSIAASWSKTTATWAAGNGNGGMDTGAVAASTWYHVHVIMNITSGAVDVLFSLSATAPTLPSGYTVFRRIGSIRTDASSHMVLIVQNGDEFLWGTPVNDVNVSTLGTTSTLFTLTVPTNIQVNALFRGFMTSGTAQDVLITSPDELTAVVDTPAGNRTAFPPNAGSGAGGSFTLNVRTNTSGQIRAVASGASTTLLIATYGWIDTRGRLL